MTKGTPRVANRCATTGASRHSNGSNTQASVPATTALPSARRRKPSTRCSVPARRDASRHRYTAARKAVTVTANPPATSPNALVSGAVASSVRAFPLAMAAPHTPSMNGVTVDATANTCPHQWSGPAAPAP